MSNSPKVDVIDLNFLGQQSGIAAFVISSNEGPILVETGPHSTLPILEAGLNDLGYEVKDVKHVFITHIHLDHAGAAWCFAEHGAKVYLHPFGVRHMHQPEKLLISAKRIYKEAMDTLWGTLKPIPRGQLQSMEHGTSVLVGEHTFTAWHSPGHAKHHIAWQVGQILFTGDVAGVCINHGPVIPPCPPPDIDIEAWFNSLDIIESIEEVSTYFLTHFGKITDTRSHVNKLRKGIEAYAGFTKTLYDEHKSNDDLLPSFQSFVQNYLTTHGLPAKDAMAYEAANPSNMSLDGLMRYWKTKQGT